MKQMKRQLGISIYPEKTGVEQTIKDLDLAWAHGFTRVFANLLEIENNEEGQKRLKMLKGIYGHAKDLGFEMIVDVNPEVYKQFNLPNTEIKFFLDLNVTGIRLDRDFAGDVESVLTRNRKGLKIELNASNGTETVDLTLAKGGNPKNLYVCHNWYPQRYTGLSRDRFMILSSHFKARGIRTAAWVTLPQGGVGPWNVNEGMPAIEDSRDKSLEDQAYELLSTGVIDDILISQQGATKKQLKSLQNVLKTYEESLTAEFMEIGVKPLKPTDLEKEIMFNFKGYKGFANSHNNRGDINDYFIRSTLPRIVYKNSSIPSHNNKVNLKPGDVVIINENLGRYKGELHIITREIKDKVNSRNLVGRVKPKEMYKLSLIGPEQKFKITK